MDTNNTINIHPASNIKIEWSDHSYNYSKEAKNRVINHFAKKYGLEKNKVKVTFKPIKLNSNGDVVNATTCNIDNILDTQYQRKLMMELITKDGKVVDFERIIALDNKVNAEVDPVLLNPQHKQWSLKWLTINNLLSFGENNYLPLTKLKGLTVVNSEPKNMGGKTILTIDAPKFLLYGTTSKTDLNEEVFNLYSGKDEVCVRGLLDLEGDEKIIERKMKRSLKKNGDWKIEHTVNYYRILPDGEEEQLTEQDAIHTTKKIKDTIGSEDDFEMLVLATEKTLDDLIGLTSTENGRLLNRLIGLEVLEIKEGIVRKQYNEFAKKKKSNEYDANVLKDEIVKHHENIVNRKELLKTLNENLEKTKIEIESLKIENDTLINSKHKIDVSITQLNPSKLEKDIETITNNGKALKDKIAQVEEKIKTIGDVKYDEDRYHELTKELNLFNTTVVVKTTEINRLKKTIDDLISGGICKSCNRKLDNIDNTEHINKHQENIELLNKEVLELDLKITNIKTEIDSIEKIKKQVDDKNKLELDRDRFTVEIGALRNDLKSKNNDLKQYKLNITAIDSNTKIDSQISMVKTKLIVADRAKDEALSKIQTATIEIDLNTKDIDRKTIIIEQIAKEEEIEKIYKIYIELIGKNGISKLVLRSVIPIINFELERLLDEVCDFTVEIYMNEKNDIKYLMTRNGATKQLKACSGLEITKSCIALRAVLGKASTLPMPNFVTFDEVLGKVAPEFLDDLKPLLDKVKDMYDIIFFITHNPIVKDWADNIITVNKVNDISSLSIMK